MRPKLLLTLALLAMIGLAIVGLGALGQADAPLAAQGPEISGPPAKSPVAPGSVPAPAPAPSSGNQDKVVRYRQLLARLEEARETRLANVPDGRVADRATGSRGTGLDRALAIPRPLGTLDKEYIQTQMQEIVPLFAECYDMALDTEPELQGRVVIETKLIGEEDIGGLIESSEVLLDQSDIVSPHFLECVRETMYALQLDAPKSGGEVVIRYPLQFRPGEEEEDEDEDSGE